MTMFKYACYKAGIDITKINIIDAGNAQEMDLAFRSGQADYIHQQGPLPQQLEADGLGHVLTALGPTVGACAFSSLAAMPAWIESDEGRAFCRAYAKSRKYISSTPAAEIAKAENPLFPKISPNKTIEGLLGGVGFVLIFLSIIYFYDLISFDLVLVSLISLPFAFIGDYFESQLKRDKSIKDSGSLIPGHGGVWDRLDSHIAVVPIFILLNNLMA